MKHTNRLIHCVISRMILGLFVLLSVLSFFTVTHAEETASSTGEITLVFSRTDTRFHFYRIDDVKTDAYGERYRAEFLPKYQNLGLDLSDSDDWDEIVTALAKMIRREKTREDFTIELKNHKGTLRNADLGVYLVIGDERKEGDTVITPAPFLLSLPEWDGKEYTRDLWIDFVKYTSRKEDVIPYRLVKKWAGDKEEERPLEIKVDLYHGKEKARTVTLNKDNQWTYCWKGERDGSAWAVREHAVPEGYREEVEREGGEGEIVFTITNTRTEKPVSPDTGDHKALEPYVIVILGCLVSAGIAGVILLSARDEEEI
ncbi:MAG: Cna B-type domain-containing protein [Solobacterium sp.]|nr:Cna B-type domain-containing protein [Solobacterium sp.]